MSKPPSLLSSHEVVSARIHAGLDGVRIGHLSDLHVRTGVKPRRLHRAVEMLNQLRPDLVALTGDYVCMSPRPLPELTAALRRLTAPAYAVLGNHDHWSGARAVRAALERAGVEVLQNEHRVVRAGSSAFHLVGVDDSVTGHDDPERAFDGVPAGATAVTLSHDPKSADHLHAYRPALILSGHTHGGQVFIRPLTPFISKRAGIKYLAGFFEVNGAVLYVNRGLGASVPIRFRAPCEVGHLTLRSAA
ncbi:MAG TPA: metallophosphoesterase [Myxococcaceae bacterium]|nr:metallophosphoesterase [Myxococcaceae bacterium]